MQNTTMMVRN